MKIAYISIQDSTNIRSFSGTGYYIPKSLNINGAEIHYIGNLKTKPYLKEKIKDYFYTYIKKKKYWFNRNPAVIRNYARQVQKELQEINPDVIVSFSGPSVALLETDKPIVLWADAVFADIIDFYPEFSNMADITIRHGHQMEKSLLDRCAHLVYSSEWAARGAIEHYNIPSEKVSVIPYGANIETNWDEKEVKDIIQSKDHTHCKLLFVGVHWQRKGGEKALEVAKNLHKSGISTELHILGSSPEPETQIPEYVKIHGFVSKETEEGKQLIHDLIRSSHFLILPTLADCTPIVFAEFNSYGIPCLTTDIGGISTVIRDGVNGKLFSTNSSSEEYVDYIQSLFSDYNQYARLAKSSYNEYINRLNWTTSGEKMYKLLKQIIQNPKA